MEVLDWTESTRFSTLCDLLSDSIARKQCFSWLKALWYQITPGAGEEHLGLEIA